MADEEKSRFQRATKDRSIVITKTGKDSMRIDHDALRKVLIQDRIADKPIAIISVAGSMRTGKSFLLNFFVRYLRKQGWDNPNWLGDGEEKAGANDFMWRGGSARCTTGIRIYDEHFEVPMTGGGKMVVLLMDSQGLFDHKTPEIVNQTLLTLSTLASSVQIFNAQCRIDSQQLSYLKTCVDFALASAEGGGRGYMKLQRLMFLVRDFPEEASNGDDEEEDEEKDQPESCFGLNYGNTYLGSILNSEDGGEEQVRIRKGIKRSFTDVACFPMPHPGLKVTKKGFTGKNAELEQDFRDYVKTFVEEVASPNKLVPLRSNHKTMTAREILNVITACDTIFSQKLFGAKQMMDANEKAYWAAKYEDAYLKYCDVMKEHIISQDEMSMEEIKNIHRKSKGEALKEYDGALHMGTGVHDINYRQHLDHQCEKRFKILEEQCDNKLKEKRERQKRESQLAILDYQWQMQALCNGVDDDKLKKDHEQLFEMIRLRYPHADLAYLEKAVNKAYEEFYKDNKEKRDEMKSMSHEERQEKLYKLVTITLKNQCLDAWKEELKTARDDACIISASKRIKSKLTEDYAKEALLPVEKKYLAMFEERLEEKFQEAFAAVAPKQSGRRPPIATPRAVKKGNKDGEDTSSAAVYSSIDIGIDRLPGIGKKPMPTPRHQNKQESTAQLKETLSADVEHDKEDLFDRVPPGEMEFNYHVSKLEEDFGEVLRGEMTGKGSQEHLKNIKGSLTKMFKRKFLDSCSKHIMIYHDLLVYDIAEKAHKDACDTNEEKWKINIGDMHTVVEDYILTKEEELFKVMSDRHIKSEELAKIYKNAEKKMKEDPPEALKILLSSSNRAKQEWEDIVKNRVGKSRQKIMEDNGENRDLRTVIESADIALMPVAWYKRLFRRMSNIF